MKTFTRIGLAFLFIMQESALCLAQSGIITTVAGNGTRGYSGDAGSATSAQLSFPSGVAIDTTGNLFIADSSNGRIRKVTPDGTIRTVAGGGTQYPGDGGPATAAQLYDPYGVAVDLAGNLFIADTFHKCVRKVTPDGVISSVGSCYLNPGSSNPAPYGVAVDTAGNLFISWYYWDSSSYIQKMTPDGISSTVAGIGRNGFSGDGGPATSAQLYAPNGVAVDSTGNLFIADVVNSRIRKVTPGGIISTVVGIGTKGFGGDGGPAISAQLNNPYGVAVDSAGNLFIADNGNNNVRKVTPSGIISTVAGNGSHGYSGDGGPAVSAQFYNPYGVAVDPAGNLFISDSNNNCIRLVLGGPTISANLTLNTGGSATTGTIGSKSMAQTGYATVAINSGAAPYGTAVFSFKQNGVTVTEAGVPASPPTTAARIFVDYRSSVVSIPSRISTGTVDINTGIAIANPGAVSASVLYTLRNIAGATITTGHGTIAAGAHFAKYINQLKDIAPDFILPANFQAVAPFASLEISSTQPLSIIALRMTINQRSEALFTTTPIADLTQTLANTPIYFPQFADGGGYTTSIILLNTSNETEIGTFQLWDDSGNPFIVTQVDGTSGSTFHYSIPAGAAFRFQTDGFPIIAKAGWIQLTPNSGTSTPVGAAVFGYNPENVLVTESGVPATVSTKNARLYVDLSGRHNTGLAIVNPTSSNANITITAFQSDGITGIGTGTGPLQLSANGHSAHFAGEFISGLPAEFIGVLDVSSPTPFAALTMRSLCNERNDFLLTTFPIALVTLPAPSPILFPQIADGGGYNTQFLFISVGGASSLTLNYHAENGTPLAIGE
jgi:sugar lactone lactonase YvrE